MKVISSYKKQSFGPLLGLSIGAHLLLFGVSGFARPAPHYGVIKAPSSMEVVLLEEPVRKKQEVLPVEEVLTVEEAEPVVEQVKEEEPKPVEEVKEEEEKKEEQKSVISPPEKGAIQESEPEYLRNPAPVYPRVAKMRGWEGLVLLDVFVNAAGDPVRVEIKQGSGHKVLDDAAVKAVRKWKFKAASLGSRSFASSVEIPVRFILEE